MTVDIRQTVIEKLKEITPSITGEDKEEAGAKFEISHVTISNYLSGRVANVDLGLNLLEFFHGKIQERIERIKALA